MRAVPWLQFRVPEKPQGKLVLSIAASRQAAGVRG